MDKLATQFKDQAVFLCINTRTIDDAKAYKDQKNLSSPDLVHGAVRPPAEYGLRYIPHKCIIDKSGVVVKNFEGVNVEQDVAGLV